MASTDYNLKLKITADNQASSELDKVSKSTEKLQKQSFQWSKSTESALKKVGATATVVAGSMIALGKSFIDASIENEPLQRSFERLSESAGIASDEMLKAMRKASRGTVADTKLMASANKAYSLGVVQNVEDMSTIMEIARVKGQAMGRTMEEALDDIVTGLGRGSVQILDNLGIVIKQTEAQEMYAKQLGKTVDQLTEAEKKQALVNAVVAQGKEELANAGEVQETMQEKLARVNAQWENMKNTIGDALIPVVDKLLTAIQPVIDKIVAWIEKNPELAVKIGIVVTAVAGLTAVLSGLALALPGITTAVGLLTNKFTLLGVAVTGVWTALNWLEDKILSTDEKVAMYKDSIEKLKEKLDLGEISQEEFTQAVEEYNQKIDVAYAQSHTFGQYLKDQLDDVLKVMTFDTERWKQALEDFGIIFNSIGEMFDRIAEFLITSLISAFERFGNTVNTVGGFFDSLTSSMMNFVTNGMDKVTSKIDGLISKLKNLIATAKEAISMVGGKVSSVASSAWNSVSSFISGKASGGPVTGGTPYLVGEKGPELFVPNTSGTIVPNEEITKNNNVTINMSGITIREDADIEKLANEIVRMTKLEKNYGII